MTKGCPFSEEDFNAVLKYLKGLSKEELQKKLDEMEDDPLYQDLLRLGRYDIEESNNYE